VIEQILAYCGPYQAANIDDLRGHKGEGFECVLLKGERVIGTATEWANDGPIRLDIPTESRDDLLAHAKGPRFPGILQTNSGAAAVFSFKHKKLAYALKGSPIARKTSASYRSKS